MQEVTVDVDGLREIVQENREQHKEIYEEAVENFPQHVANELREKMEEAQEAEDVDDVPTRITFDRPEEHLDDYDRVLRMLDMTVHDEITLTQQEFTQFVLDDWGWKKSFTQNTIGYTSG